jgi:chromosome partitioning protein
MQHVISMVGIKGGVGKSSVGTAIAAEWHARGRRTLVVDLDQVQRSALEWSDNAARAGQDGPTVIAMGDSFKSKLPTVIGDHEIVILDTPGRVDDVSTFALGLSDLGIMPCGPNGIEVAAMSKTLLQMRETRSRRPQLDAAILIAKKQPRTVVGRQAREAFAETGVDVLATELELRVTYGYAWTAGLGPTTYSPDDGGAGEIRQLVDELEGRLGIRRRAATKRGGRIRAAV